MDLTILLPEITVALTALLIVVLDWYMPKDKQGILGYVGILGLMAAGGLLVGVRLSGYTSPETFGGMFVVSGFSFLFRLLVLASSALAFALSLDYVGRKLRYHGEYYALMLLSTLGALLLSAAGEMVTFFLALELTSIPCYILATMKKTDQRSSEAGLKYLIIGALSSGILLYGFSWIFGMTGSTEFTAIADRISQTGVNPPLIVAMVMALAGMLYKISAVPFHMWTPDVYEGAPLPVTAYLSVTPKVAGFAAIMRLLAVPFSSGQLETRWVLLVAVLAAVTMTLGNLIALAQRNLKRLFAYSSIAQAGYVLVGIVAIYRPDTLSAGISAAAYYLGSYLFMNLGAFAAILYFTGQTGSNDIGSLAGMGRKAPWTAFVFTLCLISLIGLPPLAGFMGKFYLFGAAVQAGYTWLAAVGVLNSVVSMYYYVKLIKLMYFAEAEQVATIAKPAPGLAVVLAVSLIGVLALFVTPTPVISLIQSAVGNL